jgi:ketosteroid isomerase-like protein
MKKVSIFLLVVTVAAGLAAFRTSVKTNHDNLEEARKAIAASNAIYFKSFAKNDSSIFIARYAADAVILAPNLPEISGRAGVAAFFKLAYEKLGLRGGKFITLEVYGNGNEYVTEKGLWQTFDANGKMSDDGKFLVLWKKTGAGWKMYRDSFNSNHPVKVR